MNIKPQIFYINRLSDVVTSPKMRLKMYHVFNAGWWMITLKEISINFIWNSYHDEH